MTVTVAAATGAKGKALFQPMRVAITGRVTGPELDRIAVLATLGAQLFAERIVAPPERCRRTLDALQ